jgi:hypothetical protein
MFIPAKKGKVINKQERGQEIGKKKNMEGKILQKPQIVR